MTVKYKKIPIQIDFFFALVLTLISLYDKSYVTLVNLSCAFIHEAGHLFFLFLWNDTPKKISLTPFGIRIERRNSSKLNYKKEIVTAFAGPLINILFSVTFAIINLFLNKKAVNIFITVNMALAVINLLPCEPLDGGKILKSILLMKTDEATALKVLKITSATIIIPLLLFGIYFIIKSGYNFSLVLVGIYLAFFLAFGKF